MSPSLIFLILAGGSLISGNGSAFVVFLIIAFVLNCMEA